MPYARTKWDLSATANQVIAFRPKRIVAYRGAFSPGSGVGGRGGELGWGGVVGVRLGKGGGG